MDNIANGSAAKVPLIVSYPDHLPQGQVASALTEYFGLYPTLSDLCDLPAPESTTLIDFDGACETMDAASFADIVRNPDAAGPDAVFLEHGLRSSLSHYLIRTERYKFVYNDGGSCHELYDMEEDPGEFVNLIHDQDCESIARDLQDRLFAWYNPDTNPYRAH